MVVKQVTTAIAQHTENVGDNCPRVGYGVGIRGLLLIFSRLGNTWCVQILYQSEKGALRIGSKARKMYLLIYLSTIYVNGNLFSHN